MPKSEKELQQERERELHELEHSYETLPLMHNRLSDTEKMEIVKDVKRQLQKIVEKSK